MDDRERLAARSVSRYRGALQLIHSWVDTVCFADGSTASNPFNEAGWKARSCSLRDKVFF